MEILKQQKVKKEALKKRACILWKGFCDSNGKDVDLVFCTEVGTPVSTTTLRNHHTAIRTLIGAEQCRVHDLRHPYVKPMTKNIFCKIRKPKLPKYLIVWVFCLLFIVCLYRQRMMDIGSNPQNARISKGFIRMFFRFWIMRYGIRIHDGLRLCKGRFKLRRCGNSGSANVE